MSMKRVNFRRGLFRTWVVLSCLWAVAVCFGGFDKVRREFARDASIRQGKCTPNEFGDLPASCVDDWFAENFPHQAKPSLIPYDVAVVATTHPWRMVLETLAWAVAPPIGVFILGLSCLWTIDGFTRTESAESMKGQA